MKEGWKKVKLGEVCDLYQPPTISSKELKEDGLYDVFGANGIIGKYNKYNHIEPEILMTCRGATCGNINVSTYKSWINGNAMVVHIKDTTELNFYYLKYLLSFIDKKNIITGAAQPQITRQTLAPILINYPPFEEQHRIVSILDASFKKIDALKKNAEENLKNAKALFQQVLAQELKPKEGWVEKKLGEVVKHITDGDHQPPPKSNQGIPFITISNINKDNRTIDWRNTFYVPKEYFDGLKDDRKPKKGDILYTVTGSYGIPVLIDSDSEFCFQRHIAIIRPNKETVCSEFLYNWALSVYSKEQAEDTATGAAQKTVSLKSMRNFKISFPTDIEEQHRIIRTLDTLSEKCRRLEEVAQQTIRECDALKQSILRQAFSGEL